VNYVKIEKEIMAYCPRCNKHTEHAVKMPSKGRAEGHVKGNQEAQQGNRGFRRSVEPKIHPKKLSKRQKVLLECKVCKYKVERAARRQVQEEGRGKGIVPWKATLFQDMASW